MEQHPPNTAQCMTCGRIISSRHRHDFVWCACEQESDTAIAVDGGLDYVRRVFGSKAVWKEWTNGQWENQNGAEI
jgi:hypothetical protein